MSLRTVLLRARNIAIVTLSAALAIGAAIWEGRRMYKAVAPETAGKILAIKVRRGDLTFTVNARGELRGGNSEMLTVPLTGGGEMHITYLRKTGEVVKPNDVVVELDPTDQEYKLKEAESDVAEDKLKVAQAQAQAEADSEESRYALQKAESDLRTAELEVRRNPLLPTISARQNDLAREAAKDRLNQLQQDLTNRKATNAAAIAVQQASLSKAEIQAGVARKNIDALTLRAHREGYVFIHQNTNLNFFFTGMTLANFQVGDTVRAGMAVAEIPDLRNWEITADIGELDRGHLALGQKVVVTVIALPNQVLTAHVSDLGGTAGPPWNRRFQCRMRLDDPTPELRPGMSVRIVITTDVLHNALWLPAQSVFESGSRTFVYVPSPTGYVARDVKVVRRSESQYVVADLPEGQSVALSNPEDEAKRKESGSRGPVLPR